APHVQPDRVQWSQGVDDRVVESLADAPLQVGMVERDFDRELVRMIDVRILVELRVANGATIAFGNPPRVLAFFWPLLVIEAERFLGLSELTEGRVVNRGQYGV